MCISRVAFFQISVFIFILHTLINIFFLCKCYNSISGQKYKCETPKLKNGKVRIRSKGQVARFRCRKRFKLVGAKIALCLNDEWNFPVPVCVGKRIKGLIKLILKKLKSNKTYTYILLVWSFLFSAWKKMSETKI